MRSFDERKAEIFRRSKLLKEKEKKRNMIIFTLIPAVICITVVFIFILTGTQNKNGDSVVSNGVVQADTTAQTDETHQVMTDTDAESAVAVIEIKNTNSNYGGKIYDKEKQKYLLDWINEVNAVSPPQSTEEQTESNDTCETGDSVAGEDVYEIVITNSDGTKNVYILTNSVLFDTSNSCANSVSISKYEYLMKKLELK